MDIGLGHGASLDVGKRGFNDVVRPHFFAGQGGKGGAEVMSTRLILTESQAAQGVVEHNFAHGALIVGHVREEVGACAGQGPDGLYDIHGLGRQGYAMVPAHLGLAGGNRPGQSSNVFQGLHGGT